MRIAVVGCGAMGSVYAGLLAAAGHDVYAIDPWVEHVATMNECGLRVEGASGDRTVPLAGAFVDAASAVETGDFGVAGLDGDGGGPLDMVVLATKVPQVTEAAAGLVSLLGPETPVISIQNGLGGPQRAAATLGDERIVIGVVGGFGASMSGPGHVHHNGMEMVRLGEYLTGDGPGLGPRVEALAEVWRSGGFSVSTFENVHQLVWEKLIVNVAFSGPCTVTELRVGELLDDPEASAISAACATEAHRVALARGIPIDYDDPVAHTRAFGSRMPDARPSMLLDWLAGRPCEIDAINGAIPPAGAEVGVEAAANIVVTALVRTRERLRNDR